MVVLSAQDSDKNINKLAPKFFESFPNMQALAKADPELLHPLIGKVRNFAKKAKWLTEIAQSVKKDSNIPMTQEELTALPGIGRKSANVIMREAGKKPEGVIVDLHVVRVAPRLGIATGSDPKKIENKLWMHYRKNNGMQEWRCRFWAEKFADPQIPNMIYAL